MTPTKTTLWIDAEDFTDYGGWRVDTQFVHLMGSGYLIAACTGVPVADATVDVEFPEPPASGALGAGRNWLRTQPGPVQGAGDGRPAPTVFGTAATEDWLWESAGDLELEKGPLSLCLHDQTGYYGRCDALVLTTDLNFTPPRPVDVEERSRPQRALAGPKPVREYDLIVVGGGVLAGPCGAGLRPAGRAPP